GDVARNARPHFDALHCFEAAGELVEIRDRARDDLGGLNRGRRGRSLRGFIACASGSKQGEQENKRKSDCIFHEEFLPGVCRTSCASTRTPDIHRAGQTAGLVSTTVAYPFRESVGDVAKP